MSALQLPAPAIPTLESCAQSLLDSYRSTETRYRYRMAIDAFLSSRQPLTRAGVIAFLYPIQVKSWARASIHVAALKALAKECRLQGVIDDRAYEGVMQYPLPRRPKGVRMGNWLPLDQVKRLLEAPDTHTLKGKRDRALLCALVSTGLRGQEVASLTWAHYQSRDSRMCFVDVMGKGGRLRTVPIPTWAAKAIDNWRITALQTKRYSKWVFGVGYYRIHQLVAEYASAIGVRLAPHDLRRTMAKLLRANGAELEQIQGMLGHQSLINTQLYLGGVLELRQGRAAVDGIDIRLSEVEIEIEEESNEQISVADAADGCC